jgi:voltage-gated potassium channel
MYGAIAIDDDKAATEPLLAVSQQDGSPPTTTSTRPAVDRVPRSSRKRMRRQKAKRKLKEIQKEQPVLRSIFVAADQRKVKEQIKQKQQQRRASRSIPATAPAAATAAALVMKKKKRKHHSFLYSMLSPYSNQLQARVFKRFIAIVILTDLILFILSTDPSNPSPQSLYLTDAFFHVMEGIVSGIFLVEYLARFYCITEKTKYAASTSTINPAWRARLTYMTTWPALLDLFATLPFFVELATQWWFDVSLPRFTFLRCFRLFRILKTDSYIVAMDAVYRVVYYNREILTVAMLVCLALVLFTSVLLYICRPRSSDNSNNNVNFDSIGDTLYIATLMLTGQGGPDGDNLPWYTKAVILLTSVFSVAMFAIPASMLTWGFEAEAERMAKRARKRALQEKKNKSTTTTTLSRRQEGQATAASSTCTRTTTSCCSSDASSSSSSSSSSARTASDSDDGDTTDEEYFKLIAGEEDDDDDDDNSEWMKHIRADFATADGDMDGTLTIKEFLRMQVAARQQQQQQQEEEEQQGKDTTPSQQVSLSSTVVTGSRGSNNDTLLLIRRRLEALERQSAENAQKLDQILAILLEKQQQKE